MLTLISGVLGLWPGNALLRECEAVWNQPPVATDNSDSQPLSETAQLPGLQTIRPRHQTRTTSSNSAGHRKHEVAQKIDGPYFKFPEHEKGVGFQDKC
jgi:hypothetical protein